MTDPRSTNGGGAPLPHYLSPRDLETLFRIPRGTSAKWRTNGSGPPFAKLGAKVLYQTADVVAWINERRSVCTTNGSVLN